MLVAVCMAVLLFFCVRPALLLGVVCLCGCVGCLVYTMYHHPSLDANNWHSVAPVPVAIATVTFLAGGSRQV